LGEVVVRWEVYVVWTTVEVSCKNDDDGEIGNEIERSRYSC